MDFAEHTSRPALPLRMAVNVSIEANIGEPGGKVYFGASKFEAENTRDRVVDLRRCILR